MGYVMSNHIQILHSVLNIRKTIRHIIPHIFV
nr:MAG TPA: hypothetical protein [Caudoviricetes sp.]